MKANELMIGDWVYFDTAKIRVAGCRKYNLIYDDEGKLYTGKYFDPIPLTPEILEKNGFEYGNTPSEEDEAAAVSGYLPEKGWLYDEGNGEVKIIFPSGTDGGVIETNDHRFNRLMQFVFADISVHELQHALRLCGIEKEIKL